VKGICLKDTNIAFDRSEFPRRPGDSVNEREATDMEWFLALQKNHGNRHLPAV
jgi:hypothetical protein